MEINNIEGDDLDHLEMKGCENGCEIYLGGKNLRNIEEYSIKSGTLPGSAELSVKMLVKYP